MTKNICFARDTKDKYLVEPKSPLEKAGCQIIRISMVNTAAERANTVEKKVGDSI